jgi:hypothetical protein
MKNRKSGKGMQRNFKCICGKAYATEQAYKNHKKICEDKK